MNVFRDVYKDNRKQLNALMENEELFDSYIKRVRALGKDAEQRLEQLGNHFFELLDENQLTVNDFSNKDKGVCGYFVKLKNGKGDADEILGTRVLDAMEDPNESEKVRVEQVKMLKSARLALRHLDQLRLLDKIETKVREINEQSNRFLLSDTQSL